ncbi:hypothetical protein AAKU55_002352 [Oxalobacteraceae bacterium GrIS 1.11]
MGKNIRSIAVLCAAMLAQGAQAAVIDISSAPAAIALAPHGSVSFGDKFKNNLKDDVFADHFTFTTSGTNKLDLILTSISTSPLNGLNISGLGLYRWDGRLTMAGIQVLSGAVDKWTLADADLAAGSYYLKVSGNLVSNTGGAFAANGHIISAVPEPDSYALILAGVGLIAWLRRRRRVQAA